MPYFSRQRTPRMLAALAMLNGGDISVAEAARRSGVSSSGLYEAYGRKRKVRCWVPAAVEPRPIQTVSEVRRLVLSDLEKLERAGWLLVR